MLADRRANEEKIKAEKKKEREEKVKEKNKLDQEDLDEIQKFKQKSKLFKLVYQSISMLIFIFFVYYQISTYQANRNNFNRYFTLRATN